MLVVIKTEHIGVDVNKKVENCDTTENHQLNQEPIR